MNRFSRSPRLVLSVLVLLGLLIPVSVGAQTSEQPPACARAIFVQTGDTLSTLAGRHLGSTLAHGRLLSATNAAAALDSTYATIQDPNNISAGWKLCIPAEAGSLSDSAPEAVGTQPPPDDEPLNDATVNDVSLAEQPPLWEDRLTEGGPHPLSIDYLRAQEYPASPIVIERSLAAGSNYSRQIVSYMSEGLKIEALMTIPFGDTPEGGWPAIVFNHGYIPPEVYRPDERYVSYVDGFARNGYIVFRPDYRGHADSEGEARSAYGSPDYTIDVLNALAAVRQHPQVDAYRIGMWGHSMGGYITVRSMVTAGDIKAGVIWAGVVASYPDLLDRWRRRNADMTARHRSWRTHLTDEFGTPQENSEPWAALSANTFVGDLSGPVQLHHGTADASVPVSFSELLYDEILAAGGDAEYYTYDGDDHNLSVYFSTAMQRSIDFFDQYVKAAGGPPSP